MKKLLFIIPFLCFFLVSTTNAQKNKGNKNEAEVLTEEYYQGLGTNLDRIHRLMTGVFVQYNIRKDGIEVWSVNGGEDSIIVYSMPFGVPSKDGYWIYHHQIMTNIPDMPIYAAFENMEAVGRDTFIGTFYNVPAGMEIKFADLRNNPAKVFEKVRLDKLEKSGEILTYVRRNATSFEAITLPYFSSDKERKDNTPRIDFYKITVRKHFMTDFSKQPTQEQLNEVIEQNNFKTFFKRILPEDVSLFKAEKKKK